MMAAERVKRYVDALEAGDLEGILALFSPDATVRSPLQGLQDARRFYTRLLAATKESRIAILMTLHSEDDAVAAHLRYDWTLRDGSQETFECVDLFRIGDDGRFGELKIFYDPGALQERFERQK